MRNNGALIAGVILFAAPKGGVTTPTGFGGCAMVLLGTVAILYSPLCVALWLLAIDVPNHRRDPSLGRCLVGYNPKSNHVLGLDKVEG
jgi:hypothetical protein